MRYLFGFLCVCALGMMPLVGCSETAGDGGSGGSAGDGGSGGTDLCESVTCDDTECKTDGVCNPTDGMCDYTLAEDGAACSEGECLDGVCAPVGAFPCTEQGIRDAIAQGGGPHFFACDGPTTVTTADEIAIDNDVILDGEGNLTVDGDDDHRVFSVPAGVTAEFAGLSIRHGAALGGVFFDQIGGGILNDGTLTLMNSTVSGNAAEYGGGIESDGPLTLTNSTVSGNAAGGIRSWGPLTLTNSAVSGNNVYGILNESSPVTLTNSTVSGNEGFGIISLSMGSVTLTNSTVSGNEDFGITGSTTVTNSLIDGYCPAGTISGGHNIESPGDTCGFDQEGDQASVTEEQLNLGPLQDNGGPTETHALLPGSVAIDVIPADMCEVDTDQRGFPRDSMCDIGAFEVQP